MAPTFYHLTGESRFEFTLSALAQLSLAGLLESGVRVLLYVGKLDWICNYKGNYAMAEALEWSGKEGFNAAKLTEWSSGKDSEGGQTKTFGNFSYLDLNGAGHMSPRDKPEETLWMVQKWLRDEAF